MLKRLLLVLLLLTGRLLVLLLLTGRLLGAGCDDPGVRVFTERRGDVIHLFAESTNCLDITLTLMADLKNMRPSVPLPLTIDTHGRALVELATVQPDKPGKPWQYSYR